MPHDPITCRFCKRPRSWVRLEGPAASPCWAAAPCGCPGEKAAEAKPRRSAAFTNSRLGTDWAKRTVTRILLGGDHHRRFLAAGAAVPDGYDYRGLVTVGEAAKATVVHVHATAYWWGAGRRGYLVHAEVEEALASKDPA